MTWATRFNSGGEQKLELLVLWRGTPGWFVRGNSSGSSGGGGADTLHASVRYGGIDLDVQLDFKTRTAVVAGKKVALGDANVILVDKVDAPDGIVIGGTFRLDASFPRGSRPRVDEVARRSPEIMTFLRCDDEPPDDPRLRMFAGVCALPAESQPLK